MDEAQTRMRCNVGVMRCDMPDTVRLLEPVEDPARLEFKVRVLAQFSSRGTFVRITSIL